ncbi:MAG TPA: glycosyltransferase family 39 protein [Paludibacteraceae bacterium]|nr:glycosyltransferase family 39 protein [Paludibacteraceae bacterium]
MKKSNNFFKTIYQKYPYLFVLFLSLLLTIPWTMVSDFYTKGEPREAAVAQCILNTGNWILPTDYADETAYKPPLMHWMIALFSLPAGKVSETTARLPSALGLIGITVSFFVFLSKRTSKKRALLATLLMLTSFEMHRSGIEARVDMLLSFFMIASLICFYIWEEKGLRKFPWFISLLLAGASLIKGPVGIVLPCLVFIVYLLLLQKYSFWKIIWKNIVVALPAVFILLCWYYLAYRQGGEKFLNVVYAENFGRFLGQKSETLDIAYNLGHENPFWYYIPAILTGFLPWSLVAIFSLFAVSYKKLFKKLQFRKLKESFKNLKNADKLVLFSTITLIVVVGFYSIPSSKRSVYIMPVYPFAAYLLVFLYEWAMKQKPQFINWTANIIFILVGFLLLLMAFSRFVNLSAITSPLIKDKTLNHDIGLYSKAFQHPGVAGVLFWLFLATAFVWCLKWKRTRIVQNILFTCIGLFIGLQVFLEGFAYPIYKNGYSVRPFAEKLQNKYSLKNNVFVMNNLKEYPNLYALNFYLGNRFKNFEKEKPEEGYFLTGEKSLKKIRKVYGTNYQFTVLENSGNRFNDIKDVILFCRLKRIK